jgi:hypothetical protein
MRNMLRCPPLGNGHTLDIHTAGCGNKYTLHIYIYTAGCGKGYTLHVITASGGNGYTMHVHIDGVDGGKKMPTAPSNCR